MTPSIHAIIPAAGKPKNRIMLNSNLPDAMTIINGKPIIGYIVEDILSRGIQSVSVVLNPDDTHTELYVRNKFGKRCELTCVYNENIERGPGHSIILGAKQHHDGPTLVYLGDTIYKGPLSFAKDFLVTAPYSDTEQARRWSFVEKQPSNLLKFIDKPTTYTSSGQILCGIYFFRWPEALRQAIEISSKAKTIEISDLLAAYQKQQSFTLVPAEQWYDCGNIENYYKAKIDFLKVRGFNAISYDDQYGSITKRSKNTPQKIRAEIAWYRQLPKKLQIFVPRLIRARTLGAIPEYSIEFYGYPSLADMFLFESVDLRVWQSLIRRLFGIIGEFRKFKKHVPKSAYVSMYYAKTMERLATLRNDPWWNALTEQDTLRINGTDVLNLPHHLKNLQPQVDRLYNPEYAGVVHGDLCLSNILFDPASRIFKFIDPRGRFGTSVLGGDTRYDIAKLRHSFHGLYDFIVSDLFEITEINNEFTLTIFSEAYNEQIAQIFDKELIAHGYSLADIAFIEGLLFLSMIPLHADNLQRQKALYLRAMQILAETL